MKKALGYGAGLIALYLIVYYGSNSGRVIAAGASGTSTVVKAFQGR